MRVLAIGGTMLALALAAAQPAAASTTETDCEHLAGTLTAATPGETIVLSGLCSAPNANFVLPETAALTIEGAPGGVNGFDGTGAGGEAAVASPSEGVDGLTLRNLTFENYEGSGGVFIKSTKTATHPFAVLHDTFLRNTSSNNGGGLGLTVDEPGTCAFSGSGSPVTLADSTFSENTETFQAGGGAFLDLECKAGSISATVTGNVFTHNRVASNTEPLQGGGLWVGLGHDLPETIAFPLTQQNNLLEANAVENTAAEAHRVDGGGEFTDGGNVTSLDDRFIANHIDGAKASTHASEGGGFASLDPGPCSTTLGASSTATNLIAAGNTIGAPSGTGEGGEGAGVYVGCIPGGGGYHLSLYNSTISGNTAQGGGVAGLDGETNDTVMLANTILVGNLGGSDVAGFGVSDGENVFASFSDVCPIGISPPPFPASICVAPALVDAPGGDVHETAASPTIDRGLNALISQPTDAFGDARILAGRAGDAPTVDIGAAEFPAAPTAPPASTILPPPRHTGPPVSETAKASRLRAFAGGASVTITCTGPAGRTCSGGVTLRTVETLRGRHLVAVAAGAHGRHKLTVTVGSATYSGVKSGSSVTLRLKLNAKGRALLRRFHPLPVRATVTQRSLTGTRTILAARLKIPPAPVTRRH